MFKIILALLMLYPGLTLAQDASFLGGPQSSGTGTTGAASPQTLNILQPANPQGLQSADAGAGGVNLPTSEQTLQQTQSSEDVKVMLQGETEGSNKPSTPENSESRPHYWVIIVPALLGVALWLHNRKRYST